MNLKWIFAVVLTAVTASAAQASKREIALLKTATFFDSDRVSNFRVIGAVLTSAATSVVRDEAAEEECLRNLGDNASYICDLGKYQYSPVVEVIVDYSAMNDNNPVRFQFLAQNLPASVVEAVNQNHGARTAQQYFKIDQRDYVTRAAHTECRDEEHQDCYLVYSDVKKLDISVSLKQP